MASLRKFGKAWYVIWKENGRQRGKAIGGKKLAEEMRKEIEVKLLRGELVGEDREKMVVRCHLNPASVRHALEGHSEGVADDPSAGRAPYHLPVPRHATYIH